MKSYEVRRGSDAIGEMTGIELKECVSNGEVIHSDEVRMLGTTEWHQISTLPKLAELIPVKIGDEHYAQDENENPVAVSSHYVPRLKNEIDEENPNSVYLLPANIIHHLVLYLKKIFSAGFFLDKINSSEMVAHVFLCIGIVLSSVVGFIISIKTDSVSYAFTVVAVIAVLTLSQYSAWKTLFASRKLLATTPTSIQNVFILDIVGVASIVFGTSTFMVSIYFSIQLEQYQLMIGGFLILVLSVICSSLSFSPESCNVQIRTTSSGEEAIGLASFFVKILLLLGPFVYMFFCLAGCIYGVLALYELVSNGIIGVLNGKLNSFRMWTLLISGGIYPIVFYLLYLIYYLFIDVFRSILQIGTDVREIASENKN